MPAAGTKGRTRGPEATQLSQDTGASRARPPQAGALGALLSEISGNRLRSLALGCASRDLGTHRPSKEHLLGVPGPGESEMCRTRVFPRGTSSRDWRSAGSQGRGKDKNDRDKKRAWWRGQSTWVGVDVARKDAQATLSCVLRMMAVLQADGGRGEAARRGTQGRGRSANLPGGRGAGAGTGRWVQGAWERPAVALRRAPEASGSLGRRTART